MSFPLVPVVVVVVVVVAIFFLLGAGVQVIGSAIGKSHLPVRQLFAALLTSAVSLNA
jgi:hypothetical protein